MGKASRAKRERRASGYGKPPDTVQGSSKKHTFIAYELSKDAPHERLANDVFTLFKYGFLENAATLAEERQDKYALVLDFLSAEEAERCQANISNNAPHLMPAPIPKSCVGLKPWGAVLPKDMSDQFQTMATMDSELQESYLQGLVDRRDEHGKGDYILPDLPDEVYETIKEHQKHRKVH